MFDPTTWCKCFSEWWFGDGLPNDLQRPRKITFEMLFAALLHREELEYYLDHDPVLYQAPAKAVFTLLSMSVSLASPYAVSHCSKAHEPL